MGQALIKSWTIPAHVVDAQSHVVQLTHNTLTGERIVHIDHVEFYKKAEFIDSGDDIEIVIKDKTGVLKIDTSGIEFEYTFTFNKVTYNDDMSENKTLDGQDKAAIVDAGVAVEGSKVVTLQDKKVVVYTIRISIGESKKQYVVERTYEQLQKLHEDIAAFYLDNHLAENLPSFPSRAFTMPWTDDHLEAKYYHVVQQDLDVYMKKLITIPKVTFNHSFKHFFSEEYAPMR